MKKNTYNLAAFSKECFFMHDDVILLQWFYLTGTGCNACYMESLENVGLWEGDRDHPNQVRLDNGNTP